jgi:hypothetical protein
VARANTIKRRDELVSSVPRDILLASLIGATFVLLLAVAQNRGIVSDLTRTLLSPGLRLAHASGHGAHDIGVVLVTMVDSTVYGFISFFALRALRMLLHW